MLSEVNTYQCTNKVFDELIKATNKTNKILRAQIIKKLGTTLSAVVTTQNKESTQRVDPAHTLGDTYSIKRVATPREPICNNSVHKKREPPAK